MEEVLQLWETLPTKRKQTVVTKQVFGLGLLVVYSLLYSLVAIDKSTTNKDCG